MDQIDDIRKTIIGVHPKYRNRHVQKNQKIYDFLKQTYDQPCSLNEMLYMFVNDIKQRPVCPLCGKNVSFFSNRFATFCSKRCSNITTNSIEKMQSKIKEKYNVDNASNIKEVTEKRHITLLNRYGSLITQNHISKSPETAIKLNEKGRETIQERYGVSNVSQLDSVKLKIKETVSKRVRNFDAIKHRHIDKITKLLPVGLILEDVIRSMDGEANLRYVIRCKCGSVSTHPSETFKFRMRLGGKVCSDCHGITTSRSLREIELYDFIKTLTTDEVISNDRSILKPYEMDIWVPSLNIGFEYCGLFYHNYERVGSDYHLKKYKKSIENGIRLIQIFEDEWLYKKDIVKSRIKHIIGMKNRIYARSCIVEELDVKTARDFCETYHIQGYTGCNKRFGMFFNNDLVAVMTFGLPSRAKGAKSYLDGEWELSRFCSKHRIVGGAGKLFKHFIRNYDPTKIVSYSDLRWNTGEVYHHLGFSHISNSKPNYWYIKGDRRLHRFAMRKTSSDPKNMTEWEIRKQQGWKKIYDCGHSKWVWINNI